jgi:PAS domain S-box-containing protein
MIELSFVSLDFVRSVIQNFTIIATLILLYIFIPDTFLTRSKLVRSLSVGVVFGLAAIISTPALWETTRTTVLGFNVVLVPLAGYTGGPVSSAVVAAVLLTGCAGPGGALSMIDALTVLSGILVGALVYFGRSHARFPKSIPVQLIIIGTGVALIEVIAFTVTNTLQPASIIAGGAPALISILPFLVVSFVGTVVIGSIIVYIDRKRQAEKELLDHRQHLEDLVNKRTAEIVQVNSLQKATIESTADGIVVVDSGGIIHAYNQKAAQILNLPDPPSEDNLTHKSADGLGKRTFLDTAAALLEERQEFLSLIAMLPESAEQIVTTNLRFKNGRVYELYVHPHLLGNRWIGRVWSFHDITRQIHAQEALRTSEENFRSFVENANEIVFSLNPEGVFTYISPNLTELLGYKVSDLIGKSAAVIIHPDDFPRNREIFLQAVSTGKKMGGLEYRVPHTDGTWRWYSQSISPLHDAKGRIFSIQGICHDITERKTAEDAITAANNKLVLLSSLTRHDIFNQLTAVSAYLELLDMDNRDPATSTQIDAMRKSLEVIRLQLEFTKDYEVVGLKKPGWESVESAFYRAADSFSGRGVEFHCSTGNVEIFTDPMIGKVFYNLIDNSFRHGKRVTEIRLLSAEQADTGLVLLYEDNGTGVPPDEKEKIFIKGFGKHTGLGMFLIREILSITGITIRETGTFGQGVRFEICIPAEKFRITSGSQDYRV